MRPRKHPPHVEIWRDRQQRLRCYFRKGKGPRTPLPMPGSEGFDEAYAEALTAKGKRPPEKADTIAALILSYQRSPEYLTLRTTSKAGYKSSLETLYRVHGHRSVSGLNRKRIQDGVLAPYAERPGAALMLLKTLRILIRHAIAIDWLTHDPSVGIKRPKSGEIRSWTDAEIAQFEKRWPLGTKERTAFALHLYTGQRRSDVHRMTWADITGDTIAVIQQKTGRKLTIAMHRELLRALKEAKREHVVILPTAWGKLHSVEGYSNWFRDAITAAGLPLECQPHGLRKAAGRRLADAGCTAHEIMSVLGHKTLTEAERYTREADQARLASAAVTKLEGRKRNRNAQTGERSLGKSRESDSISNR
jgi:integrase